jgi:hypothetical protein
VQGEVSLATELRTTGDKAIQLYCDESGNHSPNSAVLIVGAVEVLDDPSAIEKSIRALWDDLSKRRYLEGHPGFERFKKDGFHAAYDPPEVANTFLEFLGDVPFRAYMHMTDRSSSRAGITDQDRLKFMYTNLLGDLLLRFKSEPKLQCFFEVNEELNSFFETASNDAARKIRQRGIAPETLPTLTPQIVSKHDLMSMAIIDYVMVAVQRWASAGRPASGRDWPARAFRAVEPSISVLLSLEDGPISSRKQPLH